MGQMAVMGSYDTEKIKNIAKHLAIIPVEGKYSFDRLEVTPEGSE